MSQQEDSNVDEATLQSELQHLLNSHSAENQSNTPDFILAEYLIHCLDAYDHAVRCRAEWYGRIDEIAAGSVAP